MKLHNLLPLVLAALPACSSGPSKEESARIFAAASTAMTSAQSRAVSDAQNQQVAPADELVLNFTGACSLGGSITLVGSYTGDSNTNEATFDLRTTFNDCRELQGSIDGELRWTSAVTGTGVTMSMIGDLDWDGPDGAASCELDVQTSISQTGYSYTGSVCGHSASSSATWPR